MKQILCCHLYTSHHQQQQCNHIDETETKRSKEKNAEANTTESFWFLKTLRYTEAQIPTSSLHELLVAAFWHCMMPTLSAHPAFASAVSITETWCNARMSSSSKHRAKLRAMPSPLGSFARLTKNSPFMVKSMMLITRDIACHWPGAERHRQAGSCTSASCTNNNFLAAEKIVRI